MPPGVALFRINTDLFGVWDNMFQQKSNKFLMSSRFLFGPPRFYGDRPTGSGCCGGIHEYKNLEPAQNRPVDVPGPKKSKHADDQLDV